MALSIKDEEADRLAREITQYTGESLTLAVIIALRERLARVRPKAASTLVDDVERIGKRNAERVWLDPRSVDEILGYDERGLPGWCIMVIDTSALIALLFQEPEWRAMAVCLSDAPVRWVSAVSVIEASIVAAARLGPTGIDELDLLLSRIGSETRAFSPADIALVRQCFLRYGKGRHPAALNFGDCFSYALAVSTGESLLFKGDDFTKTDVVIAAYGDPRSL
jgi:ribonuclease VapC